VSFIASISRGLSAHEKRALAPFIADADLDSAILHIGKVPWYLPRRFAAIVRGRHVYLRQDGYAADTLAGLALLGHELIHVGQYRRGMTVAAYLWSARAGYRNNPFEKEAFDMQSRILAELTLR
jgi:hypothetical protein